MDYASFPDRWTGSIGAEVIDLAGVERIRQALDLWGAGFYPPGFRDILDGYEARLEQLAGRRLGVDLTRS